MMNRKKIALLCAASLTLTSLAGCGSGSSGTSNSSNTTSVAAQETAAETGTPSADARVLKLSTTKAAESYAYDMLLDFAAEVEELSGGTLVVEIYPASQLGGQSESVEGMGLGTIEMGYLACGATESFYPASGLMGTLFTAVNEDHAMAIWNSDIATEIMEAQAQAINVRCLDYSIEGSRSIWSKTPVNSLSDLKGLKLRVPEVPIFMNVFEGLGTSPTPMALSEVYTGIQTGIVDGVEYDLTGVLDYSFDELCKYCYETHHGVSIMAFMIAENLYQSLTDEQKNAIDTASADISAAINEQYYVALEESRQELEAEGVVFTEMSEDDMNTINEIVAPLMEDYIKDYATIDDLNALKALAE